MLHKGLSAISTPSTLDKDEQKQLSDYNWSLIDENGKGFNFEAAKGKVVVINFWATWCPPCIAEMPSLDNLYLEYKDHKDVVLLYVTNDAPQKTQRFKKKNGYQFEVFRPVTAYPEAFDVNTIPRTFIVDKSGTIVLDKTGAANWNSKAIKQIITTLVETKM
ncbi:hypothetical protein GCM10011364_08040 [Mangrovimonas yunxiaonensis]|nr:hypothetical protein GCM10011364_08040 [Mangrovimonas yunxiaonensis]